MEPETAKQAVVAVGDGRGFIVNTDERLIVTAAHCLPQLPPAAATAYLEETTYQDLVGRIDDDQKRIWVECLFVDPVADIAVLGGPDDQVLSDQWDAHQDFVEELPALEVGGLSSCHPTIPGLLLGLGGEWGGCEIRYSGVRGCLWIENAVEGIVGGMSGSPIMNTACEVVGVLGTSGGTSDMGRGNDGSSLRRRESHISLTPPK